LTNRELFAFGYKGGAESFFFAEVGFEADTEVKALIAIAEQEGKSSSCYSRKQSKDSR